MEGMKLEDGNLMQNVEEGDQSHDGYNGNSKQKLEILKKKKKTCATWLFHYHE
jgi:hypothetical protein